MRINIQIKYFQENDVIVALCPELQVSSFGDTIVEAERSIKEALELFFDGCKELGTLSEVLEASGFSKLGPHWIFPSQTKLHNSITPLLHQSISTCNISDTYLGY